MKISYKQDDIHEPDTVTITCSKAEAAALKYYAEYYATAAVVEVGPAAAGAPAIAAAASRVPGSSALFNFSVEFQSKLFK